MTAEYGKFADDPRVDERIKAAFGCAGMRYGSDFEAWTVDPGGEVLIVIRAAGQGKLSTALDG